MTDRLAELAETMASLEHSVRRLESRVEKLESHPQAAPSSPEKSGADIIWTAAGPLESKESNDFFNTFTATRVVSLVGRTFLVLAGAFLLRAITDSGTLPPGIGVGAGLIYALAWIWATAAAVSRGRRTSAVFHATCSAIISYPLTWEAVRSFHVLAPETALLIVAAITAIGYRIAWRHRLRVVAWVFTIAALATTVSLHVISSSPIPATALLITLGIVTLWLARSADWLVLPWLPAFVADVAVERIVSQATSHLTSAHPGNTIAIPAALALTGALVVGYLGSVALLALWHRQSVGVFEMFQTAAVLAAGVGGAIRVAGSDGDLWIGVTIIISGALGYWVSFTVVAREFGRGRDFVYFSTLSLALIIIGMPFVVGGGAASVTWAILAVGAAIAGARYDRFTLRAHAAVLAAAAAIQSGLMGFEIHALTEGSINSEALRAPLSAHFVLVAVFACLAVIAWSQMGRDLNWPVRLPLVALISVTAAGLCAELVALLATLQALEIGSEAGIAALRTGVLSTGVLALAVLAVKLKIPEFGWLVYPLLALIGLKIVLQDLPAGRPLSIAIAFVFYGTALIAGSRLLRGRSSSPEALGSAD